jgi:hypothetical protein
MIDGDEAAKLRVRPSASIAGSPSSGARGGMIRPVASPRRAAGSSEI